VRKTGGSRFKVQVHITMFMIIDFLLSPFAFFLVFKQNPPFLSQNVTKLSILFDEDVNFGIPGSLTFARFSIYSSS